MGYPRPLFVFTVFIDIKLTLLGEALLNWQESLVRCFLLRILLTLPDTFISKQQLIVTRLLVMDFGMT
jgi:hypothetical protein